MAEMVELADDFGEAVREGESPRLWYRRNRLFKSDGQWYFHTREGVDVGPYKTDFDAEVESSLLKQKLKQCAHEDISRIISDHLLDTHGGAGGLNTAFFTEYLVETGGVELLHG